MASRSRLAEYLRNKSKERQRFFEAVKGDEGQEQAPAESPSLPDLESQQFSALEQISGAIASEQQADEQRRDGKHLENKEKRERELEEANKEDNIDLGPPPKHDCLKHEL